MCIRDRCNDVETIKSLHHQNLAASKESCLNIVTSIFVDVQDVLVEERNDRQMIRNFNVFVDRMNYTDNLWIDDHWEESVNVFSQSPIIFGVGITSSH